MVINVKNNYCISCIVVFINASVLIVINEKNLVALLVYPSFRRVATSSLRRISVSTSSGRQSQSDTAQIRTKYEAGFI